MVQGHGMRSDALPIWMIDRYGNTMPPRWCKWWGRTPGKGYKTVKRQGKWWTLGIPARLADSDRITHESAPRADVHAWMQDNVGCIGDGRWDFRAKMWYDADEGQVMELRIYFPDQETMTQFLLVFAEG